MCGIIGYTGKSKAVPILIRGLATLEYRGYDSAGIAVCEEQAGIISVKTKGRLSVLEEKLEKSGEFSATCGIGHTRWATHGKPSDENSHPHLAPSLALVHNGIIENYAEIGEMLRGAGYEFVSETDTESAAKLIDMLYAKYKNPLKAIAKAIKIIVAPMPSALFSGIFLTGFLPCARIVRLSSLAVRTGALLRLDIPAILEIYEKYYRLDEGVLAVIERAE